jgi:hypothetical protein
MKREERPAVNGAPSKSSGYGDSSSLLRLFPCGVCYDYGAPHPRGVPAPSELEPDPRAIARHHYRRRMAQVRALRREQLRHHRGAA